MGISLFPDTSANSRQEGTTSPWLAVVVINCIAIAIVMVMVMIIVIVTGIAGGAVHG